MFMIEKLYQEHQSLSWRPQTENRSVTAGDKINMVPGRWRH